MSDEIAFIVFGRAAGKGSKRVLPIRGASGPRSIRVVDSNERRVKPWEANVRACAAEAMDGGDLWRGAIAVELSFYFARPKGHLGTGRNAGTVRASAPEHPAVFPDVDKITRAALDAMTGTVYADDAQVVALGALKRYGEPERLEVRVRAL